MNPSLPNASLTLALGAAWGQQGSSVELGGVDILVVPGGLDMGLGPDEGMALLARRIGKGRVLYVPGLEDLAGATIEQGVKALRTAAKGKRLRVLYRNRVDIGGVAFLGAMFWPSLTMMGTAHNQVVDGLVQKFPSYQTIVGSSGGSLRAAEIRHEHSRDLAWLKRQLTADPTIPKVVITHFAPAARSLEPPLSLESALHASSAAGLVKQSLLWIHGRASHPVLYRLGRDPEKGLVVGDHPNLEEGVDTSNRFVVREGRVEPASDP